MPRKHLHPNASVIRAQSAWLRRVSQALIVVAVLILMVGQTLGRARNLEITTSSGVSLMPWLYLTFLVSAAFAGYYWCGGSVGIAAMRRRWSGYGPQSMQIWARTRGWRINSGRSFHFPFPEMRKNQAMHQCVAFQHEDQREWVMFEATCRGDSWFDGTVHMTGIAFTVDPTWTDDLPLVTVNPGSAPFVGGGHNLRDRRWERQDLDSRFQIDARVLGQESELKFVHLFSPEVQMALGDSFCAYWQQSNSWILVWIPGLYCTPQQLEGLYRDALWLHGRYAQFARGATAPHVKQPTSQPLPQGHVRQVHPPVPVPVPIQVTPPPYQFPDAA